jgi:hypothetical protein
MVVITLERAIELAEKYLNNEIKDHALFKDTLFVVERALVKEFDDYWLLFYQTDRYIKSGDVFDALVGNLPIKVSKAGEILGFEN